MRRWRFCRHGGSWPCWEMAFVGGAGAPRRRHDQELATSTHSQAHSRRAATPSLKMFQFHYR